MKSERLGFLYALITVALWGPWGALINEPTKAGFPETLSYVVWSLTLLPTAIAVLWKARWNLDHDRKSILYGLMVGLLGSGGQLVLFKALRIAPASLVFSLVALSPMVTILMSTLFTKEKASPRGWLGIAMALAAGVLLSWEDSTNTQTSGRLLWMGMALFVFLAWGLQCFVLARANRFMKAHSLVFYIAAASMTLTPIALWMTDFSHPINWHFDGMGTAALIQLLNAIGTVFLVQAFRHGKAIIVSPTIDAGSPVITVILSLILFGSMPNPLNLAGIILALIATMLMSLE